jgi:hypothetical protein
LEGLGGGDLGLGADGGVDRGADESLVAGLGAEYACEPNSEKKKRDLEMILFISDYSIETGN